jgi:hypothetical protein
MKHKLAEGCFLLAVISGVSWLGGWLVLAGLAVFSSPENEPTRKAAAFAGLTAELPMLFFGWLYQKLKK